MTTRIYHPTRPALGGPDHRLSIPDDSTCDYIVFEHTGYERRRRDALKGLR